MSEPITEQGIREIVAQAAGGDRQAVHTLVKGITSDMYFITRLYIKDRSQARESEQAALRDALGRLQEGLNSESFQDWISGIVRDGALQAVTPVSREGIDPLPYSSDDEYSSPENVIAYSEEECRVRILQILDALPDNERIAAALRYYDRFPLEEIAEKLGIDMETARDLTADAKYSIGTGEQDLPTFLALIDRVNPPKTIEEPIVVQEEPEPVIPVEEPVEQIEATAELPLIIEDDQPETDDVIVEEPKLLQETAIYEKNSIREAENEIKLGRNPYQGQAITVNEPEEEDEDEEEEERGFNFLHLLIVLLLAAAALGAIYYFLFMRKPAPSPTPTTQPAVTEPEKQDEDETKTDEGENASSEDNTGSQTAEPAPAPTPVIEAFNPDNIIGTAFINVEDLRIRNAPNTTADEVGYVEYGVEYVVYQVIHDNGLTWYRLDENEWIGCEDGWVTYTEGYTPYE